MAAEMQYLRLETGTWHRKSCRHVANETDADEVRSQLPLEGEHCSHCIGGFEFGSQ